MTQVPPDTERPSTPLPPGSRLGPSYTVLGMVGEDAVSVRYQVRGEQLGNTCLARVFTAPECRDDEWVRDGLRAAALAQSRITHGHVMAVRDVFALDGAPVVVTDFVDGPTLASWLASRGPLAESEATDVVRQVLSALVACHRKNLYHLSLRPDCLTLAPDGEGMRIVVDDFGTARVLGHPEPRYQAPEQQRGAEADARADVYALGLLFYELLTGELPDAERGAANIRTLLPTLPLIVERVILRALARSPDDRFATARAMRVALSSDSGILAAVKPVSSSALRQAEERKPRPEASGAAVSRRGVALAALLVLAVLAGWGGWRLWSARGDAAPADDAALDVTAGLDALDARAAAHRARQPALPTIGPDAPLPVDALPALGTAPALVELVFVTDLEQAFRSPLATAALVEPLRVRYGDNLRVSWILLPERSRPHALERSRAALAADLQGAFLDYAAALVRQPALAERSALVALATELGLDARRFVADLDSPALDARLTYHESLAQQLGPAPLGAAFVNGSRLGFGATRPRVLTLDALTAAIDAELDAVQQLLADRIPPEVVAARRTTQNLVAAPPAAAAAALAAEQPLEPYTARRVSSSLDGLPGLGASNAPLSLVLYVDLERPEGRTILEQLEAFYLRYPETVRLVVKLAPLRTNQAGFDLAMDLMAEHAAGRFWNALAHDLPRPPTAPDDAPLASQAELLRSRMLDHSREAAALGATDNGWPIVLANGRVLETSPGRLERGLEEERQLVENLVAAGLERDAVHLLVAAASEPIVLPPDPAPGRFLVANWQALPRSGAIDAPVLVFWRFSLLDPAWPTTLRSLVTLRQTLPDEVALVLAPAPPSDADRDDPSLRLFESWWGTALGTQLEPELERLLALAADDTLRDDPDALVTRLVAAHPQRRPPPPPEPLASDDDDSGEHDAEAHERAAREERRRTVESHARQWTAENAESGSVLIAWRRGLSFVGWNLPGGLAFEPYWQAVRHARQRQAP